MGSPNILLRNGLIVTMDQKRRVIENGAIAIAGGEIMAVGETDEVTRKFKADIEFDFAGHALFPGLINTNTHLLQTLMKGLGDNTRDFLEWINTVAIPMGASVTAEDCRAAALLGCIESIRSGTTTIADCMYAHHQAKLTDEIALALQQAGMRGVIQRAFGDVGWPQGQGDSSIQSNLTEGVETALGDTKRLIGLFDSDKLRIWLSPITTINASEEALVKSREFVNNQKRCWLSIHLGESKLSQRFARDQYGSTELEFLERLGFLGSDVQIVHAVWLSEHDLEILKRYDIKVSHQPVSNMYLSNGIAQVPKMLSLGVTIGLGTDGAASNNNQDMLNVLKTTALIHKVVAKNRTAITAEKVLEMATIDGARSLGMDKEIGSIQVGKRADVMALNLKASNTAPAHNPVSALVYASTTRDIDFVMVDGEIVLRDGFFTKLNEEKIIEESIVHAQDLVRRSGFDMSKLSNWGTTAAPS